MSTEPRSKVAIKPVDNHISNNLEWTYLKRSGNHLGEGITYSKLNKINLGEQFLSPIDLSIKNGCSSFPQNRLRADFFDIPCTDLAKRLLGKILVRKHENGTLIKGRIVETESYPGGNDKASFSYRGKITPKTKASFMKPGTAYVYMTYGMYHCINISSHGDGAAVLLRAVEPLEGIDKIVNYRQIYRSRNIINKKKEFKHTELCNGPSKLCIGFDIDKNTVNEKDLSTWPEIWFENDRIDNSFDINSDYIVTSKRIGIDSAGEPWASLPLRFYIYNSLFVSKRDKLSENYNKQRLSQISDKPY